MAAPTCFFSCCSFLPSARLRNSVNPIARIGESEQDSGHYCCSNSWNQTKQKTKRVRFVVGSSSGNKPDETSSSSSSIPSWADPESEEPPPWATGEGAKPTDGGEFQIPFIAYLLASAITAIAAIGSVFEYVNQKPVFGVLDSDSIFYAPVLGFFALTGIPTSAYLWFKSVQVANKDAEEQDRKDGYL